MSGHSSIFVLTKDGHIYNLALASNNIESGTTSKATYKNSSATIIDDNLSRITIKIEDSDDEEVEDVELWNDEDGLLESFETLESSVSPAKKRQRTSSPLPSRSLSMTSGTATSSCIKIDRTKHYVGSEDDAIKIICAFDGLLIFYRLKDPVLWISRYQFRPGYPIERQIMPLNLQLQDNISRAVSSADGNQVFFGTQFGTIYQMHCTTGPERITTRKLYTMQEQVASIILAPQQNIARLIATGTVGRLCVIDVKTTETTASPIVTAKQFINTSALNAFAADGYIYILTSKGRVVRILMASIGTDRDFTMECLDLPSLRAFVPILGSAELLGFYGINKTGQVLRFSADLIRCAKPKAVSDARENITEALAELERLSQHARRLEAECQASSTNSLSSEVLDDFGRNHLENQRLATYNRLVFELQQSILAQPDPKTSADAYADFTPPVETTLTAFTQILASSSLGSRRYYVRLNIKSKLHTDWSSGWSVVTTLTSDPSGYCAHNATAPSKSGYFSETLSSLAGLSPQTPWVQDLELDFESGSPLRLPLTVTLGLQFSLPRQNQNQHTAYFLVEALKLDAIHFSEPARDHAKHNPAFLLHSSAFSSTIAAYSKDVLHESKDITQDSRNRIYRPADESPPENSTDDDECERCKGERLQTQTKLPEFKFSTADLEIPQCLPALLGDSISSDQATAFLQTAFRATLYIPEQCLPRSREKAFLANENTRPVLQQSDSGFVWITLEIQDKHKHKHRSQTQMEKEKSEESIVRACVDVRGPDPVRVQVVRRAMIKRIEDLFG
ncbi:hypothetical protein BGZ54_006270 [Gamsiella multidivaricata]|nr:hypothetical protein BGZ54_006270 [Gamsiella multidivaricata]